jgi:hypothetical protein
MKPPEFEGEKPETSKRGRRYLATRLASVGFFASAPVGLKFGEKVIEDFG